MNEQPFKQGSNYKPNDLKINNASQYQEAYHNSISSDKILYKQLAKNFKERNWNSIGLLSPSNDFIGEAKIMKDYPLFPFIQKPKVEKNSETTFSAQP